MTSTPIRKMARHALLALPVVVMIGGFIGWLYWGRPQNKPLVLAASVVVSLLMIGYTSFLARRAQRRLDEVQLAHQRFAHSRGWSWGMGLALLLLMLTPVTNWLIDLANRLTTGSPDMQNRSSVQIALFFGFMLVGLMQTVCIIVAAVIWERRMATPEQT